jgi:hydroxymethylbilane synthase
VSCFRVGAAQLSFLQQWQCESLDVSLWIHQQRQWRGNGRFVGIRIILQWVRGNELLHLWPLMKDHITIGTRGSKLALWQADWVKTALEKSFPRITIHISVIKTKGDKILDVPLAKVGGKGLFVKEIEDSLLGGKIDLAVHSMKDMPAELPHGLCLGAIPRREQPHDVLISRKGVLSELPQGASVGTSSLRRAAQIQHARPDLCIRSLRGNLDTRLTKLDAGEMDAIVLAAAGVRRLGYQNRITEYMDESVMLPAAGQGALCIEIRSGDKGMAALTGTLDHAITRQAVMGERAFLHRLGGSCQIPIAAYGKIEDGTVHLSGLVADTDGKTIIRDELSGPAEQSEDIGVRLADKLMDKGATDLLARLL